MNWPWAKEQRRSTEYSDFFGKPLAKGRITPERCASLAPVFAAVRIVSEAISSLPIHVTERRPDGTRARVDHPALRALGNPVMSRQTLLESLLSRLELHGSAQAELVRDNTGRVVECWPLQNGIVRVERKGRTLVFHVSTRDGVVQVGQERMLYLRFGVLSPDGYTPCNPCHLLAEDLSAAENARDAASSFLSGGMMPGGLLTHPAVLKPEARERMRKSFEEAYGGADAAGKVMLLEEGVTYSTITGDPQKSQLLESREYGVREVARIWNIPASKLGDNVKTSYSSLEQDSISFLQQSILPRVRRIEAELDRALLMDGERDRFGFHFEVDGILRATTKDRYESYAKACGGPWNTANEIRKLDDLPPIAGGDKLVTVPGAGFATDENNGGGSTGAENTE